MLGAAPSVAFSVAIVSLNAACPLSVPIEGPPIDERLIVLAAWQLRRLLTRHIDVSILDGRGVSPDALSSASRRCNRGRERPCQRKHYCAGAEKRSGRVQHATAERKLCAAASGSVEEANGSLDGAPSRPTDIWKSSSRNLSLTRNCPRAVMLQHQG
jgi:hypothetical protein